MFDMSGSENCPKVLLGVTILAGFPRYDQPGVVLWFLTPQKLRQWLVDFRLQTRKKNVIIFIAAEMESYIKWS